MNKIFVTAVGSPLEFILSRIDKVNGARALLAVGAVITVIIFHLFQTWWCLRHIPGPFLASITNFQRAWWVKTGRAHLYHQAVHAKYGDVARIGPHMVSISNPEAIPTLYPIRPGFPKVRV